MGVRWHRLEDAAAAVGAEFVRGALAEVDDAARTARTVDGRDLSYDALLVAHDVFGGLLRDLEEGYAKRVAFVVPPGATWPLPAYEPALMTAWDTRDMGQDDVEITVYTPEKSPLGRSGGDASAALLEDLRAAGVGVETGVRAGDRMPVALPDRVTVLTCIGCGAMGRQERCEGDCAEHKLVLVGAADYRELMIAADAGRASAERLAEVARAFAREDRGEPREALLQLRRRARLALRDAGPALEPVNLRSPATVTGWWCHRCGNVDLPQPCIGVCVWRPAEWVNVDLYERGLAAAEPVLRAADALRRFVARAAAVSSRDGQWARNRQALGDQARAALAVTPSPSWR